MFCSNFESETLHFILGGAGILGFGIWRMGKTWEGTDPRKRFYYVILLRDVTQEISLLCVLCLYKYELELGREGGDRRSVSFFIVLSPRTLLILFSLSSSGSGYMYCIRG